MKHYFIQDKAKIIKIKKMGISVHCKWKRIMKEIIAGRNQKHSAFKVIDNTVTRDRIVEAILTAKECKKPNLILR